VNYGDDDVLVDFEARPTVVEQSRAKARDLSPAVESA